MQRSHFSIVEAFVHTSLDLYAFIAVTASSSTLDDLLDMVKSDNQRQQQEMDQFGITSGRSLNVSPHFVIISSGR
jgi:hypothetical protein